MKNLFVFLVAITIFAPVFGQTRTPKKVRESFEKMVPSATDVNWSTPNEREMAKNRVWTATYTLENDSALSRFDYKGNWIITLTYVDVDKLPEAVINKIETEYNSAKLLKAARLEEPGFDGFGVRYLYKGDTWSIQISKEGDIVRRKIQGESFNFD